MTVLLVAESAVLVLLSVLVAGLLRSHAEILRALHGLGADLSGLGGGRGVRAAAEQAAADEAAAGSVASAAGAGRPQVVSELDFPGVRPGITAPRPADDPVRVTDVTGGSPWGEAVGVAVPGAPGRVLLAFLSSGCSSCTGFWRELRSGAPPQLPERARLVVVTKGAEEESISALRGLAEPSLTVVMSTQAWRDYAVPGSPYFLLVDGPSGAVLGEGSGSTWSQVLGLLGSAVDDGAILSGDGAAGQPGPVRGSGAHREARADRELAAAGILPGHPSLYLPAAGPTP